jgi:hypothetical protein
VIVLEQTILVVENTVGKEAVKKNSLQLLAALVQELDTSA